MPVSDCLDYWSFVVSFEVSISPQLGDVSCFFQDYFEYSRFFEFTYTFKNQLNQFLQKSLMDLWL